MNENQKAAMLMARASAALIEALGMMSENMQRESLGQSMAYDADAFHALLSEFGIDHNSIVSFQRD